MSDQADTASSFLGLHTTERPLLLPNPWGLGSALGEIGVGRVSVGSSFAFAAYGALLDGARELRVPGTLRLPTACTPSRCRC
jgi:2-methylisocitrate lyase-like PEP mutase family enzyme